MNTSSRISGVLGAIAAIVFASAAAADSTRVAYQLERKPLSRVESTDLLTFDLFDDSDCTNLVYSEDVPASDPNLQLELIKFVRLLPGKSPKRTVRMQAVIDAPPLDGPTFLRVSGMGILPTGSACQLQSASIIGPVGPQGETGADGAEGPAGVDGVQGPPGADGAQGPAGVDGVQGPAGADGPPGPTGPTGPQGPAGADGAQGPAGTDGAQGPMGAQGPVGADGPQGPAGAQGPAGVAQQWLGGGGTANRNAATEYFGIFGVAGNASNLVATVAPLSGTISDFRLRLSTAPGAGDGFTFTLRSGVNSLVCNVNASGDATCPGTLAVTAGDLVYLQESNTGPTVPATSPRFQWGAKFSSL